MPSSRARWPMTTVRGVVELVTQGVGEAGDRVLHVAAPPLLVEPVHPDRDRRRVGQRAGQRPLLRAELARAREHEREHARHHAARDQGKPGVGVQIQRADVSAVQPARIVVRVADELRGSRAEDAPRQSRPVPERPDVEELGLDVRLHAEAPRGAQHARVRVVDPHARDRRAQRARRHLRDGPVGGIRIVGHHVCDLIRRRPARPPSRWRGPSARPARGAHRPRLGHALPTRARALAGNSVILQRYHLAPALQLFLHR